MPSYVYLTPVIRLNVRTGEETEYDSVHEASIVLSEETGHPRNRLREYNYTRYIQRACIHGTVSFNSKWRLNFDDIPDEIWTSDRLYPQIKISNLKRIKYMKMICDTEYNLRNVPSTITINDFGIKKRINVYYLCKRNKIDLL